jgi:type II secretory pathway pseudopilin PulG
MLMVIAIIGILAGILTPALMGVFGSANEFTITSEIQQMDAEIEQFKIEYGFYPPTIGTVNADGSTNTTFAIRDAATMRRYLNRISPNHAEVASGGLANWWTNVGQHLDEKSSMIFWLSGLCKSKQYPLSGNATIAADNTLTLAPYNSPKTFEGVDGVAIERDARFEFQDNQFTFVGSNVSGATTVVLPNYNQPAGKDSGDLAYRYLDSKSYAFGAYFDGIGGSGPNFLNPTSFQIVAPGMDGNIVDPSVAMPSTNIQTVDAGQLDNITNFTAGRLDKIVE